MAGENPPPLGFLLHSTATSGSLFLGLTPWGHSTLGRVGGWIRGKWDEAAQPGSLGSEGQAGSPTDYLWDQAQRTFPFWVGYPPLCSKGWDLRTSKVIFSSGLLWMMNDMWITIPLSVNDSRSFLHPHYSCTCPQELLTSGSDLNLILTASTEPISSLLPLHFDSFLVQFSAV